MKYSMSLSCPRMAGSRRADFERFRSWRYGAAFRTLRCRVAAALFLALPVAAGAGEAPADLAAFVTSAYGGRIEFDVLRNGKTVGEHVTTFTVDGNVVRAESNMRLVVSVLFVPVYRFTYSSRSTWEDGRLVRLDAHVDDDDAQRRTTAVTRDGALEIRHEDTAWTAAPDLIPTDHWNPVVLARSEVLNTITGRINAVEIERCGDGATRVAADTVRGECYELTGELNVRVWYDGEGRWVGLAFRGSDGSEITYRLRRHGTGAA